MSKDIIMVLMLAIVIVMTAGTFAQGAADKRRRREMVTKYGRRIARLQEANQRLLFVVEAKDRRHAEELERMEKQIEALTAKIACKQTLLEQRWKAAQ